MDTQKVRIGSRFFERELQGYANWRESFWRENIQNSVDAGSASIHINLETVSDNVTRITFADDGEGMSRDILENVYFTLGESGKQGEGTIGGFGRARILTCFSQVKYQLSTRGLHVNGSGANYTIEDMADFYDGVKLVIDVKSDAASLESNLRRYLELCRLPCKVFLNGERWASWSYARNHKRDLSFGKVYTNHSKDARLLVRVNGTLMFSKYISSPAQVILEINPPQSRKVLLSNRDGLVWEQQRELDSFITELNINKRSALRRLKNKSTTFRGNGTFAMKRKGRVFVLNNLIDKAGTVKTADGEVTGYVHEEMQKLADGPHSPIAPRHYHDRLQNQTEREEVQIHELFDVKIDDDTTNPKIKKIIESYDPRNWTEGFRIRNGTRQYFQAGADKYKLLLMWKVCCERALEILLDKFPQAADGYNWGVGWVFSDYESGEGFKTKARHAYEDGVHYLLINPVEDNGTMAYRIASKDDMLRIMVYAIHEICHFVCEYHDEDFASLFTELSAKMAPQFGEILNAMKEAKSNGRLSSCNAR